MMINSLISHCPEPCTDDREHLRHQERAPRFNTQTGTIVVANGGVRENAVTATFKKLDFRT